MLMFLDIQVPNQDLTTRQDSHSNSWRGWFSKSSHVVLLHSKRWVPVAKLPCVALIDLVALCAESLCAVLIQGAGQETYRSIKDMLITVLLYYSCIWVLTLYKGGNYSHVLVLKSCRLCRKYLILLKPLPGWHWSYPTHLIYLSFHPWGCSPCQGVPLENVQDAKLVASPVSASAKEQSWRRGAGSPGVRRRVKKTHCAWYFLIGVQVHYWILLLVDGGKQGHG